MHKFLGRTKRSITEDLDRDAGCLRNYLRRFVSVDRPVRCTKVGGFTLRILFDPTFRRASEFCEQGRLSTFRTNSFLHTNSLTLRMIICTKASTHKIKNKSSQEDFCFLADRFDLHLSEGLTMTVLLVVTTLCTILNDHNLLVASVAHNRC